MTSLDALVGLHDRDPGAVDGSVEVTSAGVYIVAAFCAGFSERHFLRIVQAQLAADDSRHRQARYSAETTAAADTVVDSMP